MSSLTRLKTLFDEAVDLTPAEREGLLVRVAESEPELAVQLRELLSQLSLMPAAFLEDQDDDEVERPLEQLGRYRICRELGRGGMGVVYLAQQDEPRRLVALKVIRHAELATDEVKRRFEAEASVLARLQHPGIAHVYDAGAVLLNGEHVPYFAMELVEGDALDLFVERTQMARSEVLSLFARICDGVEAAHRQGIVHRDLKPANIIVASDPAGPKPKILDFGVARVLDGEDQVSTMHTRAGDIIGTVGYMSPEQLAGKSAEVDARADVYALGVLLFRLLTGRMPYELQGKSLPKVVQQVHEEDPTRLASISSDLRGDLDAIVSTALERDLDRRYATAGALAADIRRHISNQPIEAQPASQIYLAKKFVRRHRTLVSAVALTTTALVLALFFSLRAYFEAERERVSKELALETSDAVVEFLTDMLNRASPESGDRKVTVVDALRAAEKDVEERFADRPVVAARIQHTLGHTLFQLGELDRSKAQLEAALRLPSDEEEALNARRVLALIAYEQGDLEKSARLGNALVADFAALPAEEHAELFVHTLLVLSRTEAQRSRFEVAAGHLDRADEIVRELIPDDEELLLGIGVKRATLSARNLQWDDVIARYEALLPRHQRHFGPKNVRTLAVLGNLASGYEGAGALDKAMALTEEALALHLEVYGPSHLYTINNVVRKVRILAAQGQGEAALKVIDEQGYDVLRAEGREESKFPVQVRMARGRALTAAGRTKESIEVFDDILEGCRKTKFAECIYYTALALLEALERAGESERWRAEATTLADWLDDAVGAEHARAKKVRGMLIRVDE
ncbi:MAG: protein kinase [Deltaproteobacteria bacterium]